MVATWNNQRLCAGFYFKVRSVKTFPKATWSARKGKAVVFVYLARVGRHEQKGAPDCLV